MTLETQLKGRQVVLMLIPAEQYQDELVRIIKFIGKNSRMVLYVSLNKSRRTLMDIFKRNRVDSDKFSVVEFLTPHSITELSFRISSACQNQRIDGMVIDSLPSLMSHTSHKNEVLRFVHALCVRARIMGFRVIFPIPYEELDPAVMDDVIMFMDFVLDLKELRKRAVLKEILHLGMEKPASKAKRR